MALRVSKALAATIASALMIGVGGFTASTAQAASTCSDGEQAGVEASIWGFVDTTRRPAELQPEWAGVSIFGRASGALGHFDASQASMQGSTQADPAELIVNSDGGPGDAVLSASVVDGVTATAQHLTSASTPTSSHTGATVDAVTGPSASRFFVDPDKTRATVNADGAGLASALTAALPSVEAAQAVSGSPEVAALLNEMNAAITAAPSAGDLLLGQPSYVLSDLNTTSDASATGATARVAVNRFEIGGLLSASGFASSASIDLAGGEGVNGRSTLTVPTFELLGLPVLETLTTADAIDQGVDVVDTSDLPMLVRQAVAGDLAGVSDAARLLARDAGLGLGVVNSGDDRDPATADTSSLRGFLGDLPAGPDGASSGHDVLVGPGTGVHTVCLAAQGPNNPDPTATPDPIPTATPTPTPTSSTDPTPTPTPTVADPPVKQAPAGVAITSNDPPAG
jgi:hypothetical protein